MFSGLSATDIIIVFVSILLSMSIHEAIHAFMAHWLGDLTAKEMGRLSLNPLKHVDLFTTILLPVLLIVIGLPPFFVAKPVPFNPERVKYKEFGIALVGVSGPIVNFILAIIGALILNNHFLGNSAEVYNAILIFIEVNIAFFVFNMIPFPPLDGSRLLYAFAPEGLQSIMRQIESAGFMTIIVFMILLFPLISPFIISVNTGLLNFLIR